MVQGDFETAVHMVELLIMDDKNFSNWKNHLPATPLYRNGGWKHASVSLQLASLAGRYYFSEQSHISPSADRASQAESCLPHPR
jgi:hypothetical protein